MRHEWQIIDLRTGRAVYYGFGEKLTKEDFSIAQGMKWKTLYRHGYRCKRIKR